jgi:hypothetical protein
MPGFNPDEPRDPLGKWTTGLATAVQSAATDKKDPVQDLLEKAKQVAPEVEAEANKIGALIAGDVSPVNFKSETRMREKAQKEYGGDATKIVDSVRTMIFVPYDKLQASYDAVSKLPEFQSDAGGRAKVIGTRGEQFGFQGVLTNFKTSKGISAEIQINAPGMIYAKEDKKDKNPLLPQSKYDEIFKKTGLPPGKGHTFYEEIRSYRGSVPTEEQQKRINFVIKQSEEYYSHFQGF